MHPQWKDVSAHLGTRGRCFKTFLAKTKIGKKYFEIFG